MTRNQRILIIDGTRAVHDHIRTLLVATAMDVEAEFFALHGDEADGSDTLENTGALILTKGFKISSAYEGQSGIDAVRKSVERKRPISLAIVDLVNPGGDAIEIVQQIWEIDPDIQIVLCADDFTRSWSDIATHLKRADSYLLLRKPFVKHEILQVVYALTEKHELTRQVKEQNEKRYRALYNDAPAMFLTFSRKGRVVSANDYGATQLGYSTKKIVGIPWHDLLPKEAWPSYRDHLALCFQTPDKVFHWQGPRLKRDGEVVWVREATRTLPDPEGQLTIFSVCNDMTEARQLERKLAHQSKHDPLTGLVNRKEMELRLSDLLGTNDVNTYALYLLDIDQFRVVNDACGHEGGDELLRQVTRLLKQELFPGDIAARLAGDQFAILQRCADEAASRAFAERVRDVINGFRFASPTRSFFIGVSCGVIPFVPRDAANVASIIEAAEVACENAKETGRNKVSVFTLKSKEVESRHDETRWITRIQEAIENDSFILYQQPIVPTDRSVPHGHHYEILLRLLGDDGKIIPPGAFIPAAERYGLVRQLDEWVVKATLAWLKAHPEHMAGLECVSINLSGRSIASDEFLVTLLDALADAPVTNICFEITETAAVGDLESAIAFIERVRALGCSFSLDDFGSGLSSFGYLKRLPVDYLKIDGSLIKNIAVDEEDFAMVRSIAEVARTLGKKTVAEYVEDDAIFAKLVELNVDYAQGYGIGRPEPIDTLLRIPVARAG